VTRPGSLLASRLPVPILPLSAQPIACWCRSNLAGAIKSGFRVRRNIAISSIRSFPSMAGLPYTSRAIREDQPGLAGADICRPGRPAGAARKRSNRKTCAGEPRARSSATVERISIGRGLPDRYDRHANREPGSQRRHNGPPFRVAGDAAQAGGRRRVRHRLRRFRHVLVGGDRGERHRDALHVRAQRQLGGYRRQKSCRVSSHYRLTVGTFEENVESVLGGRRVDIAFVDAIHTGAFVRDQYSILRRHLRPGALVLFDDIGFSADMRDCWTGIAAGPEVISSARLGDRLGIVEVGSKPP
jgi:hypothetical protein